MILCIDVLVNRFIRGNVLGTDAVAVIGAGTDAGAGATIFFFLFVYVSIIPILPEDILYYVQQLILLLTKLILFVLLPYEGMAVIFLVCVFRFDAFFRFK